MGRVLQVPGGVGPKLDSEEGADPGPRGPILLGLVLGARAELGAKQALLEAGLSVAHGPCWGLGCPLQQEASITANPASVGGAASVALGLGRKPPRVHFPLEASLSRKLRIPGGC